MYTKSLKKISLALIVSAVMSGCTENIVPVAEENPFIETYETEKDKTGTYKVSIEEAKARLSGFMQAMADDVNTYSSDGGGHQKWKRRIGNVEAIRANNGVKTYAEENGLDIDIDTLMYVINFENEEGFALMAADKRTDPIYAIIDDGSFSMDDIDKIDNPGFIICLEDAVTKIVNDIQGDSELEDINVTTYAGDPHIKELMPTKLHTKWGQWAPYNNYTPYDNNGKCPTGCVMTAIAQILSYYQTINSISFTDANGAPQNSTLNWNQIIHDSEIRMVSPYKRYGTLNYNYASAYEVAGLMKSIGIALGATYTSNGTGAPTKKAKDWMNGNGLYADGEYDYNWNNAINALKSDYLVFISAYRTKECHTSGIWPFTKTKVSYSGGHAWVIDGYLIYSTTGGTSNLLHCNFGYTGQADGYYLDGIFDIGTFGGATEGWEYMVDWDGDNNRPESDKRVQGMSNFQYYKKVIFVGRR